MSTFRDLSKGNWQASNSSIEAINCGSLQRIADATEAMGKNWDSLVASLKWAREDAARQRERANAAERSNRSLKGVITKLKKRQHE